LPCCPSASVVLNHAPDTLQYRSGSWSGGIAGAGDSEQSFLVAVIVPEEKALTALAGDLGINGTFSVRSSAGLNLRRYWRGLSAAYGMPSLTTSLEADQQVVSYYDSHPVDSFVQALLMCS
jgi:hypothetical protein